MADLPGHSLLGKPVYAPFIRHDQYGHLGLVPQSPLEYMRLALLALTVVPAKILGVMTCLTTFYLICRASALLPRHRRAEVVPWCGKIACRACLFCLGFLHISWLRVRVCARVCVCARACVCVCVRERERASEREREGEREREREGEREREPACVPACVTGRLASDSAGVDAGR